MSMTPPPFSPGPMAPPGAAPGAGRQAEKAPTKRRTRLYLVIFLILAVTAALIVVVGTTPTSEGLYVLRAKQSIPALAKLNIDQFEATSVPADLIEEGAITATSADEVLNAVDLTNATAQYPINKNAQLTTSALSSSASLDKNLAPDERLVSVRASVSRAVAGNLRPGDRVDVVVVGDQTTPVANTLLQDVEIVAVALSEEQIAALAQQQVTAAQEGRSADVNVPDPIPGLYTLRVKTNAVGALTVADQLASVYLVYRNDPQASGPTQPVTLLEALCTPAGGSSAPLPAVCAGVN